MTNGLLKPQLILPLIVGENMRNASQMLLLPLQVAILAAVLATPSLGVVTDGSKCKCLMCVCDVDPHPLPPALPSHHHPPEEPEPEPTPEYHYPPPPEEPEPEPTPEYHYPPPHEEPTPVYYLPPPAQPYGQYPSQGQGVYWPPSPVLGIVGTPGEMYPQDRGYIRSAAAHRRRGHGLSLRLVVSVLLVFVSGLLPLLA
ncbi:hypothetical protein E2562_008159 [Oryza meyeriana var. granulata]|uniref:Uncharacterized protein n=1 Tax=Oryza meyeriana var. granulata TaxID=110450 RepID=A0A6G1CEG7_9ORYZ|nr:hypothetical protein E2562_008159 [Oryza meyeriana var. granulata]